MAEEIHIAFGQRPDGRLVSVDDVERGAACGCVCATCGAPLMGGDEAAARARLDRLDPMAQGLLVGALTHGVGCA